MLKLLTTKAGKVKFWLSERDKAALFGGDRPAKSFEQGVAEFTHRECRKLYGTSKYKPNGELYTRDERPWLWPLSF